MCPPTTTKNLVYVSFTCKIFKLYEFICCFYLLITTNIGLTRIGINWYGVSKEETVLGTTTLYFTYSLRLILPLTPWNIHNKHIECTHFLVIVYQL